MTTDGRTPEYCNTISSPFEPYGSGELKVISSFKRRENTQKKDVGLTNSSGLISPHKCLFNKLALITCEFQGQ